MEKSNKIDDNILQLWRNAEARNLTLDDTNDFLNQGYYKKGNFEPKN